MDVFEFRACAVIDDTFRFPRSTQVNDYMHIQNIQKQPQIEMYSS